MLETRHNVPPEHSLRQSGDHSTGYGGEAVTDGDHRGSRLQRTDHQLQNHQSDEERSGLQTQAHTES